MDNKNNFTIPDWVFLNPCKENLQATYMIEEWATLITFGTNHKSFFYHTSTLNHIVHIEH